MIHEGLRPVVTPEGHNSYKLVKDFFFKSHVLKIDVRVPRGFVTNGASIPRALWITTGQPFDPEFMGPAIIHDYLYTEHWDRCRDVNRLEVDKLFLETLKLNGLGWYRRTKMYRALRLPLIGGARNWKIK